MARANEGESSRNTVDNEGGDEHKDGGNDVRPARHCDRRVVRVSARGLRRAPRLGAQLVGARNRNNSGDARLKCGLVALAPAEMGEGRNGPRRIC